jgi:hypothetical protein
MFRTICSSSCISRAQRLESVVIRCHISLLCSTANRTDRIDPYRLCFSSRLDICRSSVCSLTPSNLRTVLHSSSVFSSQRKSRSCLCIRFPGDMIECCMLPLVRWVLHISLSQCRGYSIDVGLCILSRKFSYSSTTVPNCSILDKSGCSPPCRFGVLCRRCNSFELELCVRH